MALLHTTTVQREFELRVKYIEEPAERDIGHPNSAEIVSITLNGQELFLTKEQRDSIRDEVVEEVFYS